MSTLVRASAEGPSESDEDVEIVEPSMTIGVVAYDSINDFEQLPPEQVITPYSYFGSAGVGMTISSAHSKLSILSPSIT
ncbi:hypothetical protein RCJ22_11885, partial [Vibrio sp. FNV 38]|nr:hypothetical protein [Vibrio sp. FNV 38]